jgi:outer membrane protein TolC
MFASRGTSRASARSRRRKPPHLNPQSQFRFTESVFGNPKYGSSQDFTFSLLEVRMKIRQYELYIIFLCTLSGGQTVQGPLSLTSAIEIGLANNPAIKSAEEQVGASKGRFLGAVSPPQPEVSLTHDYVPLGSGMGRFGEKTVGVSQSFEFPTFYFLRGSKSGIERKIAENEFAMSKLGVITEVKKAYYNVVALQEQVRIAQENLSIAQNFVKKAEVRFSVGEGTNLEKLTAQVTYSEALNTVEVQKNHLGIACAELNLAMGYGKGESRTYTLSDTLAFIPFNFTIDQLVDHATTAHPLLKANRLRLDSYSVDKSLAWSSILPNFNLAYFNKQVRDDSQNYYGASFSIGIPLWFMLDQRGKIIEASSNVSAAQSELRTAGNSIYAKIRTTYAEFNHEEKQVQLYMKEILPQAEEIFRTATKSYEAGEITYLEFLQAQQTLINSRGNYVNALLSYNLSIVAIEEAIGKTLR